MHSYRNFITISSFTVPLAEPTELSVDESTITDTTVDLTFMGIDDEDPTVVRGFFRGYRVSRICDAWVGLIPGINK